MNMPKASSKLRSKYNKYVGRVQIALGILGGGLTSIAAGVHNEIDGGVHELRDYSIHSFGEDSKSYRRSAAKLLILSSVLLEFIEYKLGTPQLNTYARRAALTVSVGELAVNVWGGQQDHSHRHHGAEQDSYNHSRVDALGSIATIAGTAFPSLDTVGLHAHTALLAAMGVNTLLEVKAQKF